MLVRFEDDGGVGVREVHGSVLAPGSSDALPFHGWLQLLSHLEDLSGQTPGGDERPAGPAPDPSRRR